MEIRWGQASFNRKAFKPIRSRQHSVEEKTFSIQETHHKISFWNNRFGHGRKGYVWPNTKGKYRMGKIWGKYYQHQLVKIYLDVCHLSKVQSTVKHFEYWVFARHPSYQRSEGLVMMQEFPQGIVVSDGVLLARIAHASISPCILYLWKYICTDTFDEMQTHS